MKIKLIGFDLYKTLLQIETDYENDITYYSFCEYLKNDYQIEINYLDFKKRYLDEYYETTKKLKEGEEYRSFNIFKKIFPEIEETKLKEIIYKFRVAARNLIRIEKDTKEILKYLKEKYHLILLTNAQYEYTMPEIKMFGLQNYFEKIYISSEYGIKKPAKNFFDLVFKDFKGIKEKEAVYIGDDFIADIKGAINANWRAIWLKNDDNDKMIDEKYRKKIFKVINNLNELRYIL
ncbi:MAG TPA: HAD family hydrolase [bacterium]|nr:HAD family hydrolase [bacterium]HOL47783.1 HAD family hydrolase [bacterium]HPQ18290.1 HAD family hydrolase [bacterium]